MSGGVGSWAKGLDRTMVIGGALVMEYEKSVCVGKSGQGLEEQQGVTADNLRVKRDNKRGLLLVLTALAGPHALSSLTSSAEILSVPAILAGSLDTKPCSLPLSLISTKLMNF